jgi:hypothetical protein
MRRKQPHPLIVPLASPKANELVVALQDGEARRHANTFRQKSGFCGHEANPNFDGKADQILRAKMPTIARKALPVTFGKQQASTL